MYMAYQCECISRGGRRGSTNHGSIFPPAKFSSGRLEVNTHCAAFEWIAMVATFSEEFSNFYHSSMLECQPTELG